MILIFKNSFDTNSRELISTYSMSVCRDKAVKSNYESLMRKKEKL